MTNADVVRKLIGNIHPVAASHVDSDRFENLDNMCTLVYALVQDIKEVAAQKDSQFGSVSKAGKHADKFLKELNDE